MKMENFYDWSQGFTVWARLASNHNPSVLAFQVDDAKSVCQILHGLIHLVEI